LRETPLGYDAESVAWLDGYIERQRVRRDLTTAAVNRMVDVLGSSLASASSIASVAAGAVTADSGG
jgi:hypothetical protein